MDMENLRNEIDEIDDSLVKLFEKRMQSTAQLAKYKKEHSVPVSDRTREREIIYRMSGKVTPELAGYTKSLYNTLFDLSKSYQNSLISPESKLASEIKKSLEGSEKLFPERAVVACQGTEGAYSQFACDRMFKYPEIMYVNSFDSVFEAVGRGLCRYGILPLENSTAGSVTAVYELMQKHKFYIVGSIKLCISHSLLAAPGVRLDGVKEIFSHEQALNQCSKFLSELKDVKVTVCANTAEAAKSVADSGRSDCAAICSGDCAELYGLSEITSGISNTENNYTRFICISKELEIYPGASCTSLMVRLPHKPGSLYSVISRFAALGVNLTKLESRPVPGSDFEFMFYFDVDASVYSPELAELITQLENELPGLVYLGSYNEF
jgi:chorismate mutase/prephenate dehydratase